MLEFLTYIFLESVLSIYSEARFLGGDRFFRGFCFVLLGFGFVDFFFL